MNYKEALISGTSYRRAKSVKISNPVNGVPTIYFVEEQITTLDTGEILSKEVDQLMVQFDPISSIELLDPNYGNPTGNFISHAEIYQILYSIYMSAANIRDLG